MLKKVFFLLAVSFFFLNCSEDNPTENTTQSLIGKWQNTDTSQDLDKGIRFDDTNVYWLNGIPSNIEEDFGGTYTLNGDIINLNVKID